MKRFYKDATSGPFPGGGFAVLLDGKPVRTPDRALMTAPNTALAQSVAQEWAAQNDTIIPETMPLTQLLITAIDRKTQRDDITQDVLKYIDSDLLCYRAADPIALTQEQDRLWSPWLGWFEKKFGRALETTTALNRLDQPAALHAAVKKHIAAMDDHHFTALQSAASLCGSIVLALALMDKAITPEDAWHCALCEELFFERTHDLERHGLDPIEEKRRAALARDLAACAAYRALI